MDNAGKILALMQGLDQLEREIAGARAASNSWKEESMRAKTALSAREPKMRWILVSEHLPKPMQKVFFMERGSTGIHAGHMDQQEHWWCFAHNDQWPSKPHVWMPAPLPPASLIGPHEPPKPPGHFPVA